jgi:hypothetical protein
LHRRQAICCFTAAALALTLVDILSWCQRYKTFYDRNLRMFLISYSVCPWQASSAYSHVFV